MNPTADASAALHVESTPCIALIGNPNVGKTTLFNRLTNLLAKTSNFAGTTVEIRTATVNIGEQPLKLVDLPGLYSLDATSPDEQITHAFLTGELDKFSSPNGIVVVVDATHLERTLFVVGQVRELGLPTIVTVNMTDLAQKQGIRVDCQKMAERLECPVIPISARTGEGLDDLQDSMLSLCSQFRRAALPVVNDESCPSCGSCPYADGYRWAATLARESSHTGVRASREFTDLADQLLTHRVLGPIIFAAVMLAVFASVFWFAQYPMELLDGGMGALAALVSSHLPPGDLNSLLTQGVIGGVGGVLVFLPQICVLFFALAILEDCGYLSRAVLVVDRWMRRVGLPGQAFVPLLAAHACAIPAIMSTRVIEDRRDRLAAILVIPLMTCSARLPVYSMVAAMLFPNHPLRAALLFAGAYSLGMVAAFAMSWVLRRTILPGDPASLILDLPPYRAPSVSNALRHSWDRGWAFIRDAGTVILFISIAIWALSTYPKLDDAGFQARLTQLSAAGPLLDRNASLSVDPGSETTSDVEVSNSNDEMEQLRTRLAQEYSILGRAGKFVQPAFEPLGFDWKTSVGVLASFAAREVVVSTLSVLYGAGDDTDSFIERVGSAKRADGSPAFDVSSSISLLVFFVLAMQCLPTQAVTRKETGSWNWAVFQFVYMSLLAYAAAFAAGKLCDFLC